LATSTLPIQPPKLIDLVECLSNIFILEKWLANPTLLQPFNNNVVSRVYDYEVVWYCFSTRV
jgi:hypothetical protein